MKKTLFYALLLCSGMTQAFEGSPVFTTRANGAEHTLTLSRWTQGADGTPSFDYTYVQRAGSCEFRLAGHVTGITVQNNGKAELEVYNPERADGTEAPQVVMFDDATLSLTLPYKGALRHAGIAADMTPAQRKQLCTTKRGEKLFVHF